MRSHVTPRRSYSLRDVEGWLAFGSGALLLGLGVSRRSKLGALVALSSLPLLLRGVSNHRGDTRRALHGPRGVHVRAAIRLEVPIEDVYALWRQLGNLPLFMSHLESVTETSEGKSHWVARGPAGIAVEWDAEIINEIEDDLIAWRSLPGSDVVMAGSVNFDRVHGGRSTEVKVHLQYAPPGGRAGALVSRLLGSDPEHAIREDLRHFKRLMEARELPLAAASS
jgi:uncharacterized membrane protein